MSKMLKRLSRTVRRKSDRMGTISTLRSRMLNRAALPPSNMCVRQSLSSEACLLVGISKQIDLPNNRSRQLPQAIFLDLAERETLSEFADIPELFVPRPLEFTGGRQILHDKIPIDGSLSEFLVVQDDHVSTGRFIGSPSGVLNSGP